MNKKGEERKGKKMLKGINTNTKVSVQQDKRKR